MGTCTVVARAQRAIDRLFIESSTATIYVPLPVNYSHFNSPRSLL